MEPEIITTEPAAEAVVEAPVQAPVETPVASEPAKPVDQRFGNRGGRGRGPQGRGGNRRRPMGDRPKSEFDQRTLEIGRVSRVTKGGKRFSFRTTIVIGDGKGRVGVGMAKGKDVQQSIQKATNQAKKRLITVPLVNGTIPHMVEAKYSSAVVVLKPARGGVKAGGPVRVVAKLAGIHALTGKLIERTTNKINIAMATLEALKKLRVSTKIPGIK